VHLGPGTRALVTGSSRGIGRALVERLAARGATVGLAARTTPESEALADALPGEHVVLGGTDVTDRASVDAAVARFGAVDLVVAAARIAHPGPFSAQTAEQIWEMTQVNWLGTVNTVAAALPGLLARRSGHVVVVASGHAGGAVHAATTSAARTFGDELRAELVGTGVAVTTVVPGDVPAHRVADRIIRAVEREEPQVFVPRSARLRGVVP
jgi:NADP-dependent 3-hydroxy acid dehydrogenase YdfG